MSKDFRPQIKALNACGISIAEIAERANISRQALSVYFKHDFKGVSPDTADKLDRAFKSLSDNMKMFQELMRVGGGNNGNSK